MKGKTFSVTLDRSEFQSLEELCALTRRTKSNYLGLLVKIAALEKRTDAELLDQWHSLQAAQNQPIG